MATPPKRKPYNVIFSDGTYQTFDLTVKDLEKLVSALKESSIAELSDDVILVTKDVRTIVRHEEPPAPPKPELAIPEELDDASKRWMEENLSQYYQGEGREFVDE